jgi:HSP20 family protein
MANLSTRKDRSTEGGEMRRSERSPFDLALSPFSLMRRFNEDMDRLFRGGREGESGMWMPSIDVREKDNHLFISADLPGLNPNDVKVEATDEGLCISGERKREHEEEREGYHRAERSYGSFYRLVPLPEGANVEQARANFKDGVLEVTVPIPESARKRREIPVESGAPKTRTSGGGSGGA